jgi:hypothetical protein
MADERDDQTTQVGHSVVPEAGDAPETAVHQSPASADPEGQARTEAFVQTAQPSEEQHQAAPTPSTPSSEESYPTSPAEADRMAADQHDPFDEKPHLYALGAFAGAFVVAQILKRITGGDD